MEKIERQELHCHACNRYVQFDLDMSLNGNHVLTCPNCKHEHCRVVNNGRITSNRWDQRNGLSTFYISTTTISSSTSSTYDTYISQTTSTTVTAGAYLYDAWINHS